jgi:DNA (cytosine-5)-methyltransferase 1
MLRVIELFSGIGSQTQALKNIGVKHQVVATCDNDRFADKSYRALHGNVPNLGDITKVEELPTADLWTYSFPCTDISVAGKRLGLTKGGGTRSGLLWEVERLLLKAHENQNLPKCLLLENVKNLVGKNFKSDFDEWVAFLLSLGYHTYWKILNAKDYGVPQNRERVFAVSILGEHKPYEFPEGKELTTRLKDVLEEKVDERLPKRQHGAFDFNDHIQATPGFGSR